jgi:DNA invertase Pin-like site-specific DNA recombinase
MDAIPKSKDDIFPTGTGKGGILAYVRRSAEDRSGRPLHAQFETISHYVRDNLSLTMRGSSGMSDVQCDDYVSNGIRKFFVDNGISGATHPSKRPGMSALLVEMETIMSTPPYIPIHIIVYDATRLARSIDVGSQLKASFEKHGATLHLAQPRMVVEGANAELFYGLILQLAASERTATISRVKTSFKHNPDWDPRRSLGWKFDGSGTKPVAIPEEQELLSRIRAMFEGEGLKVCEIAAKIQAETGGRRCRRVGAADTETICWTGPEISFLAKKHGWKWGGGKTLADLENEIDAAVAKGTNSEEFLIANRNTFYDGVKINRAMLRKFYPETLPEWKAKAHHLMQTWIRQDKFSVDDLSNMLNENVTRPDGKGWARQTAWRIMKEEERRLARSTTKKLQAKAAK